MRLLAITAVALVAALPAHATNVKSTLRVDRPEKGAGAKVTTVQLIRGVVSHRTRALVLTDNRCNPDMTGVSHCLNQMRLANGTVITVVHNHRMMDMPCLSPGERVVLTPR
jgi:hypothetical protein